MNTSDTTFESTALPDGGQLFDIDELACYRIGHQLRGYSASAPQLHSELPTNIKLVFKVAFISICHQFNWDFLQSRLLERLKLDGNVGELIDHLAQVTATEFQQWFPDYSRPERVRAKERAQYLRKIGQTFIEKFDSDSQVLIDKRTLQSLEKVGFLDLMDLFPPYAMDPLRKKTNVLVHDLIRERILRFHDEKTVMPAIDYHIMRVYLRTGRVFPIHRSTFSDLASARPNPRTRMVTLLRKRVSEALCITAGAAGLPVPDVNYIEWQVGRQLCISGTPICVSGEVPTVFDKDISSLSKNKCIFSDFCSAYQYPDIMKLQEPVFTKSFY